jgi:serine/threonine protein kinase
VAVKKLKPEVVENEQDLDSFMAEVALMRKLKHKHIVECESD